MSVRSTRALLDRPVWRCAALTGVVLMLVLPVVRNVDGFPLSTYPMYSSARSSEVSFVTAQGIDASGRTVSLDLDVIGATDDPLVAAGELRAAIESGQAGERCREIAIRVGSGDGVVVIEVVTERHDVIDHTLDRPSVLDRIVHATCQVGADR